MLTMVAPYQTSKSRQQVQVWLWSIVVFVMFSVLISLFRVKNRGMYSNRYCSLRIFMCFRLPVQATFVGSYSISVVGCWLNRSIREYSGHLSYRLFNASDLTTSQLLDLQIIMRVSALVQMRLYFHECLDKPLCEMS